MIAADPLGIAYTAGWYFYALGPQLVLCLLLGYLAARKSAGSLLDWLIGAFFASLLPIAGAAIMVVLWWRAGPPAREGTGKPDTATRNEEPPA